MLQKKFTKVLQNRFIGNTKLLLFLIVLFGLILRLAFFSGVGISDSLVYSKSAYNIDKGIDTSSPLTLSTRLGLIYATALSYRLFGINDFSSIFFILLTSIGTIILAFYFGKLLFNEKVGLMAAFLMSFFPLEVIFATKLLSDMPSAFFMSLGVYLFLLSELKSRLKYGLGYILSGIFIGIGYLIRESALLIALFFIIYIIYKKRIKREYFLVPLGVILIFLVESLIFFSLTGDPLYRTHVSQQYLEEVAIKHNFYGRLDFPTGLLHYPYMILTNNLVSYFYIFIFIAIIYFVIKRKEKSFIPLFWFIPLLLYLSFGSGSLTQYVPLIAKDRYLSIISIPGILLITLFLLEKKRLIRKYLLPTVLVILLFLSLISISSHKDRNLLNNLREAYPIIENIDKTVYIDDRSIKAINYISKYKNKVNFKEYPNDLKNIKDSFIVINADMIRRLKEANKNREFPKEINNPPNSWIIIKEIGKGKNRVTVYYSP